MRSMFARTPSWYFRSETITWSHNPRAFRSATRYGLATVNSPDMFDFTNRLLYAGSIDWLTPQMLEIVAVGAIAITLEFRMPSRSTLARNASQSSVVVSSRITSPLRADRSSSCESIGSTPWLHNEPSYVE